MKATTRTTVRARQTIRRRAIDEAFLILFIAAMHANDHVSPEEAARAQHLIWSMRRFRRKSGQTVGRELEAARTLVERDGALKAVARSVQIIPAALRSCAFAIVSDLMLADGKIEPAERRFLARLWKELRLDPETAEQVIGVMLLKNAA